MRTAVIRRARPPLVGIAPSSVPSSRAELDQAIRQYQSQLSVTDAARALAQAIVTPPVTGRLPGFRLHRLDDDWLVASTTPRRVRAAVERRGRAGAGAMDSPPAHLLATRAGTASPLACGPAIRWLRYAAPMVIIVMGVTGSGKTTVGEALAASIGCEFFDADYISQCREQGQNVERYLR